MWFFRACTHYKQAVTGVARGKNSCCNWLQFERNSVLLSVSIGRTKSFQINGLRWVPEILAVPETVIGKSAVETGNWTGPGIWCRVGWWWYYSHVGLKTDVRVTWVEDVSYSLRRVFPKTGGGSYPLNLRFKTSSDRNVGITSPGCPLRGEFQARLKALTSEACRVPMLLIFKHHTSILRKYRTRSFCEDSTEIFNDFYWSLFGWLWKK